MKTSRSLTRAVLPATFVLALALPAGLAAASATPGGYAGKSEVEITQYLEAEGYQVREIEREGCEFEAHAVKDGVAYEIEIDRESGKIEEIEHDDHE